MAEVPHHKKLESVWESPFEEVPDNYRHLEKPTELVLQEFLMKEDEWFDAFNVKTGLLQNTLL